MVAAMGACVIRTSPIESSRTRPAAAYRCEGGVCSKSVERLCGGAKHKTKALFHLFHR